MKKSLLFFLFVFCTSGLFAQDQLLNVAREYLRTGEFEKSAATYKQLLEYTPNETELLQGYYQSVLGLKDYKTAEKIIKQQLKANSNDLAAQFELAKLSKTLGDDKKFKKLTEKIISSLESNDQQIRKVASMFEKDDMVDLALATYEKGKSFQKDNPYLYAQELALIYSKKGDLEKATESLLDLYISRPDIGEDVKASFQRMMDKPLKKEFLLKKVMKRAAKEPENLAYPNLLSWLYIQQNDYENAFIQINAIDTRLNEQGRIILGFARVAFREKQYKAALMAYGVVIEKGNELPFYVQARSEKLTCLKEQLKYTPIYTKDDVKKITTQFAEFLEAYPAFKLKETLREYAELEARYSNDIDKAILLLSEIVKASNVDRAFRGRCKLEMGDYELVRNNIWESTLLYSQVDKEFKQDMLGEEARFKNAKLSYYTGDFKWSQGQLDVLKASTSELIANDALNLSVLITENNPPADSNTTPLLMFARADLLEFQNKDEEAIAILDSITTLFPKHPLLDDILMTRAEIATKKQDFSEAAMHLQKIVTDYADDILADDAIFTLAGINETFFSNKDEAKRLYEQIIIKYPGSTYVNQARKNFRRLRGDKADVEEVIPF